MILDLKFIIYILFIHFIADFLCQSRKMGLNKGKSIKWLSYHVLVYTLVTMFGWGIYFGIPNVLLFFTLTFVTHFVTDYITSKASGYAYLKMVDYKLKREKYEKHVNMEGRYNDDLLLYFRLQNLAKILKRWNTYGNTDFGVLLVLTNLYIQ